MKTSELERTFLTLWKAYRLQAGNEHLPEPVREYRFHPTRRWRFDFAWPDAKVAVECEGGIWSRGRHVRGRGFESDCEKYNAATLLGWRVFRCTPGMLEADWCGFFSMVQVMLVPTEEDNGESKL